jgi:hypothetical protein
MENTKKCYGDLYIKVLKIDFFTKIISLDRIILEMLIE